MDLHPQLLRKADQFTQWHPTIVRGKHPLKSTKEPEVPFNRPAVPKHLRWRNPEAGNARNAFTSSTISGLLSTALITIFTIANK